MCIRDRNDAFKALSDPTRRRILELLTEGDLTAGEIAGYFDISKPSVSHHLNVLKSSGLVLDAVSYTHLDVYKRQILNSSAKPANTSR